MTLMNEVENGIEIRFRTGAAMPARLGAEQLKDEITAVIELVKNAYDADASRVVVELRDGEAGQSMTIQDDGTGMGVEDLGQKWAWLATENKIRDGRSPTLKRRRLGQKGVGRFAAQKLGHKLTLRTRPIGDPTTYQVTFDWDAFQAERELSDYRFPVKMKDPKPYEPPHGTRLEIRPLRIKWTKQRCMKLSMQLAQLIDPEAGVADFAIELLTPWPELNGVLSNPLHGKETHSLEFVLESDGRERVVLTKNGKGKVESGRVAPPIFGPVRGRLRYFGQGFRKADVSRGGDPEADWNMGVRVFRDACRVRPYGEPGPEGDWLQVYRTRYTGGSRFRLKPHYLEGSIHITKDLNPDLRDTTSREGIELNDAHAAFTEYIRGMVARLSELVREDEVREERLQVRERYRKALDPLSAGLSKVSSEQYVSAVDQADRNVRKVLRDQGPTLNPQVSNSHWECLDCFDGWKVPIGKIPRVCREHSVGRDGKPTGKLGCGSSNIRRKENLARDGRGETGFREALEDLLAGNPAFVSGVQLKPVIDWEMGENDEEAEVRASQRQLAINGRHPLFKAADRLDGNETQEGEALENLRAVAALSVHIVNAAAQAWATWHYFQRANDFEVYRMRLAELKTACLVGSAS
jgi:hypothetical protein